MHYACFEKQGKVVLGNISLAFSHSLWRRGAVHNLKYLVFPWKTTLHVRPNVATNSDF